MFIAHIVMKVSVALLRLCLSIQKSPPRGCWPMNSPVDVIALANEIRRIDGRHKLGAAELAEALAPYIDAQIASDARIQRALDYLHPHLDAGVFAAPDWAIQLASILTGGDGCGAPTDGAPSKSVASPSPTQWVLRTLPAELLSQLDGEKAFVFEVGNPKFAWDLILLSFRHTQPESPDPALWQRVPLMLPHAFLGRIARDGLFEAKRDCQADWSQILQGLEALEKRGASGQVPPP